LSFLAFGVRVGKMSFGKGIILMANVSFKVWKVPLVLLFLCFLSYGLLIPWLGFYWDDWPLALVSHSLGPSGLKEYDSFTRPFQGWLHTLTTLLLGEVPFRWHILALLNRWLSATAAWWCLRGVWPQKTREAAIFAFLFAIYPGFTLQPIAFSYGNDLILLVLFMFSLGSMIWSLRLVRWFWHLAILGLLSSIFSILVTEYYVGLELLRPVLIWLVLTEKIANPRQRFRRTLMSWSPYLAIVVIFVIWRLFLFKGAVGYLNQSIYLRSLAANPLSQLMTRAIYAFTDVIESGLVAWGQAFRPNIFDFGSRSVWVAWGLVVVSSAAVAIYLARLRPSAGSVDSDDMGDQGRWAKQAIIIGLFAILVGGLPVWFANRQIILDGLFNRYTQPTIFGSCLLVVGLIQMMIKTQLQRIVIVSAVVGLSVGFHFRNANQYRQDWLIQKSLFWQLSWRAPGLKPGTSVLIDESVLSPRADYALAAPLNLIYAPQHSSARLDYWAFYLSGRLVDPKPDQDRSDVVKIPRLAEGARLERTLRSLSFASSTSHSLVVWLSPPSCLRVLDPLRDELPQLSPLARAARPYSHVDRIMMSVTPSARPPAMIFGPEPGPCWCYYFQKADLARQMGDWQQVAQIGDEARRGGFKPSDVTEWLPFIEGYANVGRYDAAREIAALVFPAMSAIEPTLNDLWKRLESVGLQDAACEAFIADMKAQMSP
jgi:hypothetical protein